MLNDIHVDIAREVYLTYLNKQTDLIVIECLKLSTVALFITGIKINN
jgi:hypothetical protein